MTGARWMMVLCVLLVSVGVSYSAMKKMSRPLPKYEKADVSASAVRQVESKSTIVAEPKRKDEARNWDVLWKASLFKDDRTEAEPVGGSDNAGEGEGEQVNNEFELVGIARMGRKDVSTPVAIILEVKGNARNRGNNRNMGPGRRPGFPGGNNMNRGNERSVQPEPAQTPENRKANKSLYRIGDKIGTTEYVVKNIIMEQDKVVLERNGVETVLILDEKNTNNSIRRERVKNEEMAVRAKFAKKGEEKTATPAAKPAGEQQPPTMPPMRGNMPMRPGMQPGQRTLQPVQQNPETGLPPLPPSAPGGAGGAGRGAVPGASGSTGQNSGSSATQRRISPIPQRPID